jgi:7-cyano-7-deazaguanine synthase
MTTPSNPPSHSIPKTALVLLSGGLDSATTLVMAQAQGYQCAALSFAYGQRHQVELQAATRLAQRYGVVDHRIARIDLAAVGGSALTDSGIDVPDVRSEGIPVTYVPARNTIFLSFALAYAEVLNVHDIFIGVNSVDYSGYPDCRPEYIDAFQKMANLATREGVEGRAIHIHAPLIQMSKSQIIQTGVSLGLDYALTLSCYNPTEEGLACGICDACVLRKEGFLAAGVDDPTLYR